MRCNGCMSIITMNDEVHVTADHHPKYFHTFCKGEHVIDHIMPVKVKEFRNDHRRKSDPGTQGKTK